MDFLKRLFPFSFGIKDVANLVIRIIIYVIAGAVLGVILNYVSQFPLLNYVVWPIGTLTEIYVASAIAIAILDYNKILK